MTISYLFAYYILKSYVSLSSCMSIKTGLFFRSDFLLYHYSYFWYWKIITVSWKIKKKSGENNKLRTVCPKNHENFKNSEPRVQVYWFL